jgi:hypothetical protein
VSTNFYDPRAERRVAAAVADEHRAAAAERIAAAEAAREAARIEAAARAARLQEEAQERAQARKAAARAERQRRRAARAQERRARAAAQRAAIAAAAPGLGMSALWASVIIAPLLLTWSAQTAFAREQLGIAPQWAWLFPLSVETGAWVCAFEAYRRTRTGRPVGSLLGWMWLLAGVAAAINFSHGLTTHGVAAGLALAALSVLGVLLHHVRQSLDQATLTHGPDAIAQLRGRAARWVWHPVMSLRASSIAARTGATPTVAWQLAHLDRYGVGPDASRRDRRVGRVIMRRQWRADRRAARDGEFVIVNGVILAVPSGPSPLRRPERRRWWRRTAEIRQQPAAEAGANEAPTNVQPQPDPGAGAAAAPPPELEPVTSSVEPQADAQETEPELASDNGEVRDDVVDLARRARQHHDEPAAGSSTGARRESRPAARVARDRDPRVDRLVAELRKNKNLTGESAGELLGCSPRTGRRLLGEAKGLLAGETNEQEREAG